MTVRHIVQMCSDAIDEGARWKLPETVRKLAEDGKYDHKVWVIHSVHPREDSERNREAELDAASMPYRDVYFMVEDMHVLHEGAIPSFLSRPALVQGPRRSLRPLAWHDGAAGREDAPG